MCIGKDKKTNFDVLTQAQVSGVGLYNTPRLTVDFTVGSTCRFRHEQILSVSFLKLVIIVVWVGRKTSWSIWHLLRDTRILDFYFLAVIKNQTYILLFTVLLS